MRLLYVLDCADPEPLADFWAAALGFRRGRYHPPYLWLTDPAGRWPDLLLQRARSRSPARTACTSTCRSPSWSRS